MQQHIQQQRMQQQQLDLQQQQQQQQQREQQMRQQQQQQLQQQQQQQQQIRMQQMQQQQQQQQQQQASNNFEPPQQIVSMQQRLPHPVQFPGQPPQQPGMVPRPMGQLQQMMTQVSHPNMRMQQLVSMSGVPGGRMPGHPAVTAGLRLAIPPHGSTPVTPNGSALPSPALTPRSENDDGMDTGSSRGPTPGSDMMDGPNTPDLGYMNDPKGLVKRRPSAQQQKRRQSAGGKDGASGKKRSRKGSRVDDGDYDNYIDTVMHQLKNLPPIPTVEPKLLHCFNACPLYGSGDLPKMFGKEMDMHQGVLEGKYGAGSLSAEGDYYSTMPFGMEPPVPHIPPVSLNQRGFYNQEFTPEKRPELGRLEGPPSPDLFYCSSPEPDIIVRKKKKQPKDSGVKVKEEKKDEKTSEEKENIDVIVKKEP